MGGRGVPFRREKRDVLETYIFSKMWFMAQILPLPQAVAAKATSLAGIIPVEGPV
jgi:hypothetical protein